LLVVAVPASHAEVIHYFATLNGPNESPPNTSPGTGSALVTIDTVANTMRVQVQFTGLSANTTASHIHCCTAVPDTGTAMVATTTPTFTGFPLGVTSGTYDHTFDLTLTSSWNPAFITAHGGNAAGAEAALLAGLAANEAYLNIHSTAHPGGEIRGFLFILAGAPGSANCHGQSVSALAQQFGDLTHAADTLGFSSVSALQDTLKAFCDSATN
jgi:hypothetical protein